MDNEKMQNLQHFHVLVEDDEVLIYIHPDVLEVIADVLRADFDFYLDDVHEIGTPDGITVTFLHAGQLDCRPANARAAGQDRTAD